MVLLSLTLGLPFNADNAIYAYMAELLLKGRLPYLGSWDQNFPGVLAVHALHLLTLGRSALAFHCIDVVLHTIGLYYIYRITERLFGRVEAWLAIVLTSIYYVNEALNIVGERDTYVTILMVAALWCFIQKKNSAGALVLGFSILFRPTNVLYLAVVLAWLLHQKTSVKELIRVMVIASIPFVLFCLWYIAIGGFGEFFTATVLFTTKVYNRFRPPADFFDGYKPYWFYFLALPFGLYTAWKSNRTASQLLLYFLAVSTLTLFLLYRLPYHYHPSIILLMILTAGGWSAIFRWIVQKVDRSDSQARANVAVTLLLILIGIQALVYYLRGSTTKRAITDLFRDRVHSLSAMNTYYDDFEGTGIPWQDSVIDHIRPQLDANSKVQMVGQYAFIPYELNVSPASRFITPPAILMRSRTGDLQDFQKKWRKEYVDSIRKERPIYIIVPDAPDQARIFLNGRVGHEILQEDLTSLKDLIDSDYHLEKKIGVFSLYRANS